MPVTRQLWGAAPDGRDVWCYTLRDGGACEARVLSFGATLASLRVPAADGSIGEVLLGFDHLAGYTGPHPHFGGTIGRYANRIACGRFHLGTAEHRLARNDGEHHLHGGARGFDRRHWEARAMPDANGVSLSLVSDDGDEGYPGRLEVSVDYTLDDGALAIDYRARTDRPTVVNLTNHAYFNLRDGGAGDVLDHELWIAADAYTPTDGDGIPTGELVPVAGTPLDFREPRRIGERLADLAGLRGGYDHNYAVAGPAGEFRTVARVYEARSERTLTVSTTQPGLQLYSGNELDGSVRGRGAVAYRRWHGLCLETQHFPDSPNRPAFPSAVLQPDERYRHTTVYAFSRPR